MECGFGLHWCTVPLLDQGRHAVLLRDQAGWHLSGEVTVPANMNLLPLPAKCPELTWRIISIGMRHWAQRF
ncbi:MAG: hypothetical protein EBY30_08350 [Rhodospirillales bacterium]|nr:hypothetical protein [Rhodospirillales bacterium]